MKHDEGAERKPCRERGKPIWHDGNEAFAPARLMVLGAILAMALLSGCASPNVQSDSGPWNYNPETGYPASGGPRWVNW